ncbi:hypothetical protein KALB_6641 [Kutzneria albida DSM 43870]|uniref:EamA domain-containing protein n=1 Tax=Kutzneria albida DSM 43870 TaxID=1449976 RepID=W5WGX6_9PSEU|nr:hypothetical protein KALB_6641 [Kutzneria albida DSM 43870]
MVRRSWVPGFVALSAIWGSSFALIKIAVDAGVAPPWVALWRCLFGMLTLWLICAVQGARLPRDPRAWGHAAVIALLLNSVPFMLVAYGETRISSVLAGVWNAVTPLATLVFALALVRSERPTPRRLLGLGLGFVGVLVVLGVWQGVESGVLDGTLACLGSTACYGAGFAYTKRFFSGRPESASVLSAMQITSATVQLGLIAPVTAGAPSWPGLPAMTGLLVLGAVSTGVAYVVNFRVIRVAGSTVASTVTYLTPVWSTAFGWLLLGEPLSWNTLAGAVLVVGGVVLTRGPGGQRLAGGQPVGGHRAVRAEQPADDGAGGVDVPANTYAGGDPGAEVGQVRGGGPQ